MENLKRFWSNTKLRNTVLIALFILIGVLVLYYNGNKGYDYAKKYLNLIEKDKIEQIEKIKDSIAFQKSLLEKELDSIKAIENVVIKNYWNDYLKEKNRNNELQKIINNISNDIYSKRSLDSVAKYVDYNKS